MAELVDIERVRSAAKGGKRSSDVLALMSNWSQMLDRMILLKTELGGRKEEQEARTQAQIDAEGRSLKAKKELITFELDEEGRAKKALFDQHGDVIGQANAAFNSGIANEDVQQLLQATSLISGLPPEAQELIGFTQQDVRGAISDVRGVLRDEATRKGAEEKKLSEEQEKQTQEELTTMLTSAQEAIAVNDFDSLADIHLTLTSDERFAGRPEVLSFVTDMRKQVAEEAKKGTGGTSDFERVLSPSAQETARENISNFQERGAFRDRGVNPLLGKTLGPVEVDIDLTPPGATSTEGGAAATAELMEEMTRQNELFELNADPRHDMSIGANRTRVADEVRKRIAVQGEKDETPPNTLSLLLGRLGEGEVTIEEPKGDRVQRVLAPFFSSPKFSGIEDPVERNAAIMQALSNQRARFEVRLSHPSVDLTMEDIANALGFTFEVER